MCDSTAKGCTYQIGQLENEIPYTLYTYTLSSKF